MSRSTPYALFHSHSRRTLQAPMIPKKCSFDRFSIRTEVLVGYVNSYVLSAEDVYMPNLYLSRWGWFGKQGDIISGTGSGVRCLLSHGYVFRFRTIVTNQESFKQKSSATACMQLNFSALRFYSRTFPPRQGDLENMTVFSISLSFPNSSSSQFGTHTR